MGLSQDASPQLHCPVCGYAMRATSGAGQQYCLNDSCRVQFVTIVTKTEWLQRRERRETRRRHELEALQIPKV
jgi:predicted nucleic acid-binding Zn ribbon protein